MATVCHLITKKKANVKYMENEIKTIQNNSKQRKELAQYMLSRSQITEQE